jgi:hypothetical protein
MSYHEKNASGNGGEMSQQKDVFHVHICMLLCNLQSPNLKQKEGCQCVPYSGVELIHLATKGVVVARAACPDDQPLNFIQRIISAPAAHAGPKALHIKDEQGRIRKKKRSRKNGKMDVRRRRKIGNFRFLIEVAFLTYLPRLSC